MTDMFNDPTNHYGLQPELPELKDIDQLPPEQQDELRMKAMLCGCGTYAIGFVLALLLCLLMGACTTTKYVPVVEHRTDTLLSYSNTRDSIYIHDSIAVTHWGDTVHVCQWRTEYRDRWRVDTVYRHIVDSIPQPYPVEVVKEVPRELTLWQRTRQTVGGIVIFAVGILLLWKIFVYLHPKL